MHFLQHQKETFSFSLLDKDSLKILVNAMKDWMKNHRISVVCYQKYHVNTIQDYLISTSTGCAAAVGMQLDVINICNQRWR